MALSRVSSRGLAALEGLQVMGGVGVVGMPIRVGRARVLAAMLKTCAKCDQGIVRQSRRSFSAMLQTEETGRLAGFD